MQILDQTKSTEIRFIKISQIELFDQLNMFSYSNNSIWEILLNINIIWCSKVATHNFKCVIITHNYVFNLTICQNLQI